MKDIVDGLSAVSAYFDDPEFKPKSFFTILGLPLSSSTTQLHSANLSSARFSIALEQKSKSMCYTLKSVDLETNIVKIN